MVSGLRETISEIMITKDVPNYIISLYKLKAPVIWKKQVSSTINGHENE